MNKKQRIVLGCPSVRILNGGWDKWLADGNTPRQPKTHGLSHGKTGPVQ